LTLPIENYALLGNCRTAALVSTEGSIDWLCFPRFDSAACFASLLGEVDNGRWKIAPHGAVLASSRKYRDGTLILETSFTTETGRATVIDFMPQGERSCVVRIVEGVEGTVSFDMDLVIRFDYGRSVPWVEKTDPHTLTAVAGPDMLVLRSPTPIKGRDHHTTARFRVQTGERMAFTLAHQSSSKPIAEGVDPYAALATTEYFWLEFSDRCPDVGEWTPSVKRSLITLKALTYQPTGGIVAAATTSLPEHVGGERNWDYRYCWLRDATMTLLAFMNLGYFEEAEAWRNWLARSVAGNPEQMQIMYGLAGERRLPEYELPWLKGYEDSKPVRIGNAAATQFQLDIYGEVADAMAQARRGGLPSHRRSAAIAEVIMPFLEQAWRKPDEGIWEIRGQARHFTHSKVMAWVAFDRAAILTEANQGSREKVARYRRIADEIHAEVCKQGYNEELGCFVQSYGSDLMDGALLQIPLTGFLPPDDPRVVRTVDMLESRLMRDGLLLRYETQHGVDGLPPGEGTFLVCSFWLADVYGLMGRQTDARELFERLLGLCNDVGLLAEQYEPTAKRMLGNFPQAFSHIGIINAALNIHRSQQPAQQRAHPEADVIEPVSTETVA
jgi:GH15 family glucan-1,4-alpha-glucosidase